MRKLNVLSLCDGMSCIQMALEKAEIPVENVFAAEIKEHAIRITKHNFPKTIHIGDVNKVSYKNGVLYTENESYETPIDLVVFGSPCQSVSRAMTPDKRVGLEDKIRSGLFFECHRILREVNPEFFLMENVIMKPEDERVITELMGVNPVRINSALVTAQLRDRLYWTNIPTTIPTDKHIKLSDILIDGYSPWDKARCLMANDSHGYYNGCNWTPIKRFHRTVYKNFSTMIFPDKETYENCLKIANGILKGRTPRAEYFDEYVGDAFDSLRYLWKEERAKLQTVPLKYVEIMTEKEAADLCGDGWTVDVIAHILKGIKEPVKKHSIGLLR